MHSIRRVLFLPARSLLRSMSTSQTPVEDSIRAKLTAALAPTSLAISNDSSAHSHHEAMQGSISRETHFRLAIVSDAFQGKAQPARHRVVYKLLGEELAMEGGIHALQLQTRTVEEQKRLEEKGGA